MRHARVERHLDVVLNIIQVPLLLVRHDAVLHHLQLHRVVLLRILAIGSAQFNLHLLVLHPVVLQSAQKYAPLLEK